MSEQDMSNAIRHNFPDIHKQPEADNSLFGRVKSTIKESESRPSLGEKLGGRIAESTLNLPPQVKGAAATGAQLLVDEVPGILFGGGVGARAGKAVAGAIETGGDRAARFLMQSALKPLKEARESGKAARAIDTLLEKGINVSKGGVEKLRGLIDDLNSEIKQKISSSTLSVSKKKVADTLDQLTEKFKNQVNPQGDLSAIRKAWDDFMNHPSLSGRATIPVQQAQKLKQGTYKALGEKAYGEEKTASIEAQKSLARGLKEQIEKAHPEIGPLNKEEAKLLNALDLTEQRVLAEANKNPLGLTYLIHNPKSAAAFLADRSSAFKSLFARLVDKASKGTGQVAGGAAGAGVVLGQRSLDAPVDR
ncbi:MAG TPA: hypothetical protein VNZ86_01230 [Bacteroidia bacterium]|nr:hypothetical protein [Bacteroidia bacterium]